MFADVSVNATFRGFTPDRIIHAPTDINLIIARVQVMSNADTAAASSLNQAITLAAYSTSGKHILSGAKCIVNHQTSHAAVTNGLLQYLCSDSSFICERLMFDRAEYVTFYCSVPVNHVFLAA